MPQVARRRTTSVTPSTTSSGPLRSTCAACGITRASRPTRSAPEASANTRTRPNARSARIAFTLAARREASERRTMLRIHTIELGGERDERRVSVLRDEAAREIARESRVVFLAREGSAVDVRLPFTGALEKALSVQTDHDGHHGGVGEASRAPDIVNDIADGHGTALPHAFHDHGLERPEQASLGRPLDPPEWRRHATIIPPCG